MTVAERSASVEEGARSEKAGTLYIERSEDLNDLPDPDAGKSDEERAAIVGRMQFQIHSGSN